MNKLVVSILLLIITHSATHLRLSTLETTTLNVGDTLISTLGYFQATLQKTNCSLQVSMFNETNFTYVVKGTYKPANISSDCASLQVKQGQLVTDSGAQYLYVGPSFNASTIFTIDDMGVMRLIGTYIILNRVNQWSFQTNITQFFTNQTYLHAASLLTVTFARSYGPLTNKRNWTYNAQFGQLDIYYSSDPGQILNYVYSQFRLNNSQISDFNGRTFPAAIFSNITYSPRCFSPRLYLNFKPPFIFHADPYWPRFSVIEQGGYKILQLFYSQLSEFDNPHKERDIKWYSEYSVCPDQTFQFQGQCLTKCPAPYYHQMRGKRGSCILVCEQFTPKNETTRTCSCMTDYQAPKYKSQMVKACPNNSVQYHYGCVCTANGTYFDKLYTFQCVKTCPNSTFPHQGLCVNCPARCKTCQYDSFYRSLLQCKQCQPGYTILKGQCAKSCNSNLGFSIINNTCSKCLDPNCANCSTDINICLKCNILYTLNNATCSYSCPNTSLQVSSDYFSSTCIQKNVSCQTYLTSHYKSSAFLKCDVCPNNQIAHLGYCVTTCPSGYSFFGQYCICDNNLLTINDKCLNISGCPIKMSFDIISHSCLSCPFACMSCIGSVCTSCNPGYFLYISPQGIRCRRKSPLFDCSGQYALIQGVCVVTAYETLNMTTCISKIPNCQVCPIYNNQACILCKQGYHLYNNTCITACPTNFTPYQNTCILLQIQRCQVPHLQSFSQPSVINITRITKSNPYQYYIYSGLQPANDPVGYIPYFQSITSSSKQTDGLFRDNEFFDAYWTCLKCVPGQGLSDDFKNCFPCPDPCVTCYMAKNYSCLTLKQNDSGCLGYIDYNTKKCVRYCNDTNKYPQMQNGLLYCKLSGKITDYARIDSAIYAQPDGTKIVYFVFQDQLKKDANISVTIKKDSTSKQQQAKAQVGRTIVSSTTVVPLKDNSYFQVSGNTQDVYIADLTNSIKSLQSTKGQYPPNLVYGAVSTVTHPQFMKTWLAIIGQIMGVVIIAMHCVYVGNQLLYKMDNLIILVQSIYYFSFVKILVGKLLAQFYYGWIFSHAGFFPNFFTVPNGYREDDAPISYKLATLDANFVRNAGFSVSISLVYFAALALISSIVYLIYKYAQKGEVWYPKIAVSVMLAGVQFFSMNLMYWSVACLMYHQGADIYDSEFYSASTAWSIIFIVFISIYTIGRFLFNTIGGIYMVKRIIIAVILAAAFDNQIYLLPLIILQVVFTCARYLIQSPQTKKQKIYMVAQFFLFLLCYLLLFLCLNAGVNTIIISIVVFLFIVFLASDYVNLYLQSINQWEQVVRQKQLSEEGMERANSGQVIQSNKA